MSRETLIRSTVTHSLAWDENSERPIDRLTAIAYANDMLGSLIVRAFAGDEQAYFHAATQVSMKIRRKCVNISAIRVASAVLTDILDQRCGTCHGRGQMEIGKVVHVCPTCNGSKLRDTRYSPRKVGGKQIPDDLYRLTYEQFSEALSRTVGRAQNYLSD